MFEKIKLLLRKTKIEPMPLLFEMDLDERGMSLVKVFKNNNGNKEQITDLEPLMQFGYKEEEQTEKGLIIKTITPQDQQKILSLKSLNPNILQEGTMEFEIIPPVLNYLRRKSVLETQNSKQLKIIDKPMQPTARISYNPESGLTLDTGLAYGDEEQIIKVSNVTPTKDGKHIRLGNTFIPLPKITGETKERLDRETETIPIDRIPEFFQRDYVLLTKSMNAVLVDRAQNIKVITDEYEPVVSVNKDTRGWLDFNVAYQVRGFTMPFSMLLQKHKQGKEFIHIAPLTWVKVDSKTIEKTEKKLTELNNAIPTENGYRLPITEFASVEEFIKAIGGRGELSKAYREFIEQLTDFQLDESFQLPDAIEEYLISKGLNLRPYQRSGIQWMNWLRQNHLHGVLADDMGLGKTMQSLIALQLAKLDEPENELHSLIIAPKSVIHHWAREIDRVFKNANIWVYHGTSRNRNVLQHTKPFIFISTYETVANDIEEFSRIPLNYLILDEATKIKNPDTKRSQAIKSLNAIHRLALSGTPVENRPSELWSLFDFLMPGHLGSFGTFERTYGKFEPNGKYNAAYLIGRKISPFLLRRKKENVEKDLPSKIFITEWVSLSEEQKKLYGELQGEIKTIRNLLKTGIFINYTTSIFPVLTKLKQICDHPSLANNKTNPLFGRSEKFDWIIEKISEITSNNEKVVVFSHVLGMLTLLENAMITKEISYVRIDGSSSLTARNSAIEQFNEGDAKVALLSIMATGYGITMTAANHVIHADRWWNPAVEDQATDRVHRIGQTKTVYVYQILNQDTLEEKIDALLNSKRGLSDQIVGAAMKFEKRWTREELIEILTPPKHN